MRGAELEAAGVHADGLGHAGAQDPGRAPAEISWSSPDILTRIARRQVILRGGLDVVKFRIYRGML